MQILTVCTDISLKVVPFLNLFFGEAAMTDYKKDQERKNEQNKTPEKRDMKQPGQQQQGKPGQQPGNKPQQGGNKPFNKN